jgi:UDP-N-acetylglucosamine 1-carboxyvinyltransferase
LPQKYVITGGKPLSGTVNIAGCKNAAVAILPAAVMVKGVCRIENVPRISDVYYWLDILTRIGVKVRSINDTTVELDSTDLRPVPACFDCMREMRASYYLTGAMLSRFRRAHVSLPGGCDFGVRPIDQHLKGMRAMGAKVEVADGYICAEAKNGKLHGANIYLDVVSVGATMNIMLAAVLAEGKTVIENAAREPHIVDLANFLNAMGGDVRGAGTSVVRINGVEKLHGGFYSIIPDQIEAGTYLAAVAAAGGDVVLKNVIPKHLYSITAKLEEMGANVEELGDSVRIISDGRLCSANVKTMPYPGFPTDMQPQILTCLTVAEGTSVVTEDVWDNRYNYVTELLKMGAKVQVDGKTAVVEGPAPLTGAEVRACDLRAGAALVIAGLIAQGVTSIVDIYHIERGYENMVEKLKGIGADIRLVETPDPVLQKRETA